MYTKILNHDIYWTCENNTITELSEMEEEAITAFIKDGFTSGEIDFSEGYVNWQILKWDDIAMDLYNNLKAVRPAKHILTTNEQAKVAEIDRVLKRYDEQFQLRISKT